MYAHAQGVKLAISVVLGFYRLLCAFVNIDFVMVYIYYYQHVDYTAMQIEQGLENPGMMSLLWESRYHIH